MFSFQILLAQVPTPTPPAPTIPNIPIPEGTPWWGVALILLITTGGIGLILGMMKSIIETRNKIKITAVEGSKVQLEAEIKSDASRDEAFLALAQTMADSNRLMSQIIGIGEKRDASQQEAMSALVRAMGEMNTRDSDVLMELKAGTRSSAEATERIEQIEKELKSHHENVTTVLKDSGVILDERYEQTLNTLVVGIQQISDTHKIKTSGFTNVLMGLKRIEYAIGELMELYAQGSTNISAETVAQVEKMRMDWQETFFNFIRAAGGQIIDTEPLEADTIIAPRPKFLVEQNYKPPEDSL